MTELVNMTSGIRGFVLATTHGYAKKFTDNYALSPTLFVLLTLVSRDGSQPCCIRWHQDADQTADVFSDP